MGALWKVLMWGLNTFDDESKKFAQLIFSVNVFNLYNQNLSVSNLNHTSLKCK